jgi:putative multicomponent Na+:H+ antiporter subunit B
MIDSYVYMITALLPLVAAMVVFQSNPYHALIVRGILGAISALLYSVLGAPDVALTEALVGTLLATALSAVAVRSSLVLRLGVLKDEAIAVATTESQPSHFQQLMQDFKAIFNKRHMRVELVPYPDEAELQQALINKEVHATCIRFAPSGTPPEADLQKQLFQTTTRLQHLYTMLESELRSPLTRLSHFDPTHPQETH